MSTDPGIRRRVDQSRKPYQLCRCDSLVAPAAHGNPNILARLQVELPIRRSRIQRIAGSSRSTTGQCRNSSQTAWNIRARAARFALLADSFCLFSPQPHSCAPACRHDLQDKTDDSTAATARLPVHGQHALTRLDPDSR